MPESSLLISFLASLVLPLLAGFLTLYLVCGRYCLSPGLFLALGYFLGQGITTQCMLLLGIGNFPLDKSSVSFALSIYTGFSGILFLFARSQRSSFQPDLISPNTLRNSAAKLCFILLVIYITVQIVFIFWHTFFVPIYEDDAYSIYAYKAKIFFFEHSMDRPVWPVGHPLHVPLMMTWIALNLAQWHEGYIKMVFFLNCISFVTIVYVLMRTWTDKLTATAVVAFILSSLLLIRHSWLAYCDLTMMTYTMTSFLLLCRALELKQFRFIVLAGIMSAFAVAIKREGIDYSLLGCFILFLCLIGNKSLRNIIKDMIGFIFPIMVVVLIFILFKRHYHIVRPLITNLHFNMFYLSHERVWVTCHNLWNNLFSSGNWSILWFCLTGLAVLSIGIKQSFAVWFFTLVMLVFFMNDMTASILTKYFPLITGPQNRDVLSRMILHFFPLCPILIGLLMYNFLRHREE